MLALLAISCSAQPTREAIERAQGFVGDWGGTNEYGWRMEARIESIADDGGVTGTGCFRTPGRLIRGSRIDGRAKVMGSGGVMAVRFGTSQLTARMGDEDTLILLEKRESDGKKWKTRTTLKRTQVLECAHRFAPEGTEIDPGVEERAKGLIGYWTGRWPNGNAMEMAVTSIGRNGEVEGRRCLRDDINGGIRLSEFGEDGMLDATWDAERMEMISQSKTSFEGVQRSVYVLKDANSIAMTASSYVGTDKEKVHTLEMRRGVDPEGCIAWIRPADAAQETAPGGDG